mmetsp:Transcript_48091/g.72727  ORF Transcript_48091/g.72727 Transcript_48091/m.72727 type:complete len:92 (-) Transcript_48091:912-1187(-)
MNFVRSFFRAAENLPARNDNDDNENHHRKACCCGLLCKKKGDSIPSDHLCPACNLAVHPLCEVWDTGQEMYLCLLCHEKAELERDENTLIT